MSNDYSEKINLIRTVKTPINLFALIAIIIDGSLLATSFTMDKGLDRTLFIIGAILLLLVIIIFTGIRIIHEPSLPKEITDMWSSDDIPLKDESVSSWKGLWNAEWTYMNKNNELKKYVDDQLYFEKIDTDSGAFEGYGISSYNTRKRYILRGRISKRGFCHLFYSSNPPYQLSGLTILNMSPIGEVSGWWLGVGRKGGFRGGKVYLKRGYPNDNFVIKTYPTDEEK